MDLRHSPLGWFLLLSLALHAAAMVVLFTYKATGGQPAPRYYAVRIVEAPGPPAPAPSPPLPRGLPSRKTAPEAAVRAPEKKTPAGKAYQAETSAPPSAPPSAGAPPVPAEGGTPTLPREGLFDKDVITMLSKKERPPEDEKAGITFDTEELKYKPYLRRLKATIEQIWVYPREAAEKGIYGDLVIRFVIKKDGTLGSVNVIRTSGHEQLDTAALKALREAEPLWPLPEGWGVDSFTITGHFVYTIYGYYVR